MNENQIAKLLDEVAKKSLEDSKFRGELLKDANAAIKKEYGQELPMQVTCHEANEKKLVFVLPIDKELDDDTLDNVSGGVGGTVRPSIDPNEVARIYPISNKTIVSSTPEGQGVGRAVALYACYPSQEIK